MKSVLRATSCTMVVHAPELDELRAAGAATDAAPIEPP